MKYFQIEEKGAKLKSPNSLDRHFNNLVIVIIHYYFEQYFFFLKYILIISNYH